MYNTYVPGRWDSETLEMKAMRPARPKNLATKTVAWPWASGVSIHCKQGRRIHDSLQPFRRTRQPLQLIFLIFLLLLLSVFQSLKFQKVSRLRTLSLFYMNNLDYKNAIFLWAQERRKERRKRNGMKVLRREGRGWYINKRKWGLEGRE